MKARASTAPSPSTRTASGPMCSNNDSAKVQALTEGQKVTDTITVTVDDGNGGT
ncbi:VCBS domain-containing protein, partial [Achromobacter xylosoxidans]|uniref:VCBS domain-containing protein n=1 Tax=Alcaligenes xylosoxydans xylosoxydans TaxID=85698 RepID=UPI0039F175F4